MEKSKMNFSVVLSAKKSSEGKYIPFACMRDLTHTRDKELIESIDGCGSTNEGNVTQTVTGMLSDVLNFNAMEMFADATSTVIPAGTTPVDQDTKVLSDGIIELSERSSDNLGVTGIAVKSLDVVPVTYILDTDYSVATVNNKTTITILGGAISVGDTINITGSVELPEQNNHALSNGLISDLRLDIQLEGRKLVNGVEKSYLLTALSGSQTASYIQKFMNAYKPDAAELTELSFSFTDVDKDVTINDQITPAIKALG